MQQVKGITEKLAETLTDIAGVAVEYDLHHNPTQFITFIDLYCTHLRQFAVDHGISAETVPFYDFITSQTLIELAVMDVMSTTGEKIETPKAVDV